MMTPQFQDFDSNHDGGLDKAELKVAAGKMQMFQRRRNAAEEFNGPPPASSR